MRIHGSIIEEFDRLYTYSRDYAECERILKDILSVYSGKYNIELDQKEDFDHIFQELYSGIQKTIDSFTPTDLADQTQSRKIDEFFKKMSEDIFKTAEIRGRLKQIDPNNLEYKKALEKGISEAQEMQKNLRKEYDQYTKIKAEMFGKESPDLKTKIQQEISGIGNLDKVFASMQEIKRLKTGLSAPGMTPDDIKINEDEIKRLEIVVNESIDRVKRTGLVEDARMGKISLSDIDASLSEIPNIKADLDIMLVQDSTKLQNNLKKVHKKYNSLYSIAGMDFSKMDPSTEEGRNAILEATVPFEDMLNDIQIDIAKYASEEQVYKDQIAELDKENQILEAKPKTAEEFKSSIPADAQVKIDDEIDYYRDLVEAQYYGDPEYKKKYDRYLAIFKKHIKKDNAIILRNLDGSEKMKDDGSGPQTGKYTTVDYASMQAELDSIAARDGSTPIKYQDLVKFLQLEDYKKNIEVVSRIKAGDSSAYSEMKNYQLLAKATTQEEKDAAIAKISAEYEKKQVYVETFHNTTNDRLFKKQHHATAGKIGDSNLPIKSYDSEKGVLSNVGVFAYNRWRDLNLSNPFKAQSFIGGVGRGVLDVFRVVAFVPKELTVATGWTISKLGYNDNMDPNPYNGRNDARRGARADYYREVEKLSPFRARLKAWMDEINPDREEATGEAIIQRQVDEITKNIKDIYARGVAIDEAEALTLEQEKVKQNMATRTENMRAMAGTKEVQGDIIRDTDGAEFDVLTARTMQKAALEMAGIDSSDVQTTGSRDLAKNPYRNMQFEKEKPVIKTISGPVQMPPETKWGRKEGSVISADPIGRAIRSQEIKNTLTRYYAIEKMLLMHGQSMLVKSGISHIKSTKLEDHGAWKETGEFKDKVIGQHLEDPGTTHLGQVQVEGNTAGNLKFGDFDYGTDAYFEHTASSGHKMVKFFETPTADNVQAMALDYTIPNGLDPQVYAELGKLGYKAGDKIVWSVADGATKSLCQVTGKSYATDYINGLFNLDPNANVMDTITQYFPEDVAKPLDLILSSEKYYGDAGVDFLTQSFSTSHGISSLMQQMNSWGTGWAIEKVNPDALEAAKVITTVMKEIPDDPVWVDDIVKVPLKEWVSNWVEVPDPVKEQLKQTLNRVANGLAVGGDLETLHDASQKPIIPKETGRETYDELYFDF